MIILKDMRPLFRENKYTAFYVLVLFVGIFLSGKRLLAQMALAINQPVQGTVNNFYTDVAQGLQALAASSSSRVLSLAISGAEYKSAWDQFGMSVLVQDTVSQNEVSKNIAQDILSGIRAERDYDLAEARYLSASGIAPEDVQAVEGETSSDIPPGVVVSPNPSAAENPDVSWASNEDQASVEDTTSTETVPAEATSTEVSPDTGTFADSGNTASSTEAVSASDLTFSDTGTSASSSDMSTLGDEAIFNAILQGELSSSSQQDSTPPLPPQPDASSGSTFTP